MNLFGKFYYFFVLSRNIKFYVSEADHTIDGEVYATYCWYGNDEYCITSDDYYSNNVKKTYNSTGKCIFSIE